jgi:hypothetical protein
MVTSVDDEMLIPDAYSHQINHEMFSTCAARDNLLKIILSRRHLGSIR